MLDGTGYAEMQGQEVFRKAVESLSESGIKLLDECDVDVDSIDWFIPHQANIRIINKVAEKLKVPDTKVIKCVQKHANTSAASIPLALNEGITNGQIHFGDRLLLQGVGGFNMGFNINGPVKGQMHLSSWSGFAVDRYDD